MEDFAIDLDKVLDEFEQHEDSLQSNDIYDKLQNFNQKSNYTLAQPKSTHDKSLENLEVHQSASHPNDFINKELEPNTIGHSVLCDQQNIKNLTLTDQSCFIENFHSNNSLASIKNNELIKDSMSNNLTSDFISSQDSLLSNGTKLEWSPLMQNKPEILSTMNVSQLDKPDPSDGLITNILRPDLILTCVNEELMNADFEKDSHAGDNLVNKCRANTSVEKDADHFTPDPDLSKTYFQSTLETTDQSLNHDQCEITQKNPSNVNYEQDFLLEGAINYQSSDHDISKSNFVIGHSDSLETLTPIKSVVSSSKFLDNEENNSHQKSGACEKLNQEPIGFNLTDCFNTHEGPIGFDLTAHSKNVIDSENINKESVGFDSSNDCKIIQDKVGFDLPTDCKNKETVGNNMKDENMGFNLQTQNIISKEPYISVLSPENLKKKEDVKMCLESGVDNVNNGSVNQSISFDNSPKQPLIGMGVDNESLNSRHNQPLFNPTHSVELGLPHVSSVLEIQSDQLPNKNQEEIGIGARPKTPTKKLPRPNSLLGLNVVDLKRPEPVPSHSPSFDSPSISTERNECDLQASLQNSANPCPLDFQLNNSLSSVLPSPGQSNLSDIAPRRLNSVENYTQPEDLLVSSHLGTDPTSKSLIPPSNSYLSGNMPPDGDLPFSKQPSDKSFSEASERSPDSSPPSYFSHDDHHSIYTNDCSSNQSSSIPTTQASSINSNTETTSDAVDQLNSVLESQSLTNGATDTSHLGQIAPIWVPDSNATKCMQCDAKFTFTKRRHHCRACGRIFCNNCCNLKVKLIYMNSKEARVCSRCYVDIIRMHSDNSGNISNSQASSLPSTVTSQTTSSFESSASNQPDPNNPKEYCSTISPLEQAKSDNPTLTVMVPNKFTSNVQAHNSSSNVGNTEQCTTSQSDHLLSANFNSVLRKDGNHRKTNESKQVMFSDGIRPGGDLTELDGPVPPRGLLKRNHRASKRSEEWNKQSQSIVKCISRENRNPSLIPSSGIPSVMVPSKTNGVSTSENLNTDAIFKRLRDETTDPVVFIINKNLTVLGKIINLTCCLNRSAFCFSTKGMCTVGQAELVFLLDTDENEKTIPSDIFSYFQQMYENCSQGNLLHHLSHTLFTKSFLNSSDHSGILYLEPSFQCLQNIILPPPPYIFCLLIHKWEVPWAKVFPLRLMLRLGAEFRYYPSNLISIRHRKPVYGEIGHTIMNLLADFRNFQYSLTRVPGVYIHMEDKVTTVLLPSNKYNEILQILTNSDEYVLGMASNFSHVADSHLVCIQCEEDSSYQTQAINIQNKLRKVTGASFVVFNGALKAGSGMRAKSSIVEDGIMIQIMADNMLSLKQALRDMQDYEISCGSVNNPPEERVIIKWVSDSDPILNKGVISPIDSLSMEGVESVVIHGTAGDYVLASETNIHNRKNSMQSSNNSDNKNLALRWNKLFFIEFRDDISGNNIDPVDLSRLAETLAGAFASAVVPHLTSLQKANLCKLALRVTLSSDTVEYAVGSNGKKLPDTYVSDLDNSLIPVIHVALDPAQNSRICIELLFHIIV